MSEVSQSVPMEQQTMTDPSLQQDALQMPQPNAAEQLNLDGTVQSLHIGGNAERLGGNMMIDMRSLTPVQSGEEGFTVGLILLGIIFWPILGFGPSKYKGPYGNPAAFQEYQGKNKFDFEQKQ